ncbi:MAG: aminotransferase class V-fold PLP-dependent enzyme [Oscillospiraceae bacterium]|nr:aminotransferase class V-fold PLP-dependent enzyme [Oscillospiraceae bacterium]
MIYLDSAATTLQKPSAVRRAVSRALVEQTSPGRGGHSASMRAAETAYACREAVARLLKVSAPEQVVFTYNATYALNMAIKSLVGPGDRVVVSSFEHNSVIRPLQAIGAEIVVAHSALFRPETAVLAFEAAIQAGTKLVVLNHVSNVFGYILPAAEIAALCRAQGVPLMIDASQSAGVLEIDAAALDADFIAMPGHKGLYGPQGTGVLICKDTPQRTIIEGGTGSDALHREMPDTLPDRLEAGTPNMPGIRGLLEGVRFVKRRTTAEILCHERNLLRRLIEGLGVIPGVRLYAAAAADLRHQTGVLSLNLEGIDCETVAGALSAREIAVRAGLHCAPLAHEAAGTLDTGTVRVSVSAFNTRKEIDRFLCIFEQTAKKLRKSEI